LKTLANFVYEVGILNKTPRSGLWFLGTGEQSVAEHIFRTTMIGYTLAYLAPKADKERVLFLCLVHDLGEGRTSDLNYVHQKYGRLAESRAIADIAKVLPFGKEVEEAYKEEQARKTLEAKLAKDADNLEWMTTMREEAAKGNSKAQAWAEIAYKRLKTKEAKMLGRVILTTHSDDWWFNAKDKWFVNRPRSLKRWRDRS
jgi:putative hydrolase of HD superfamily